MGNINFNISEFICESPVLTSVVYTGVRYEFILNWTSQGSYYNTFDPTTVVQLWINVNGIGWQYYSDVPYDGINWTNNFLSNNPKTSISFKLIIINSGCNNESNIVSLTNPY